MAEPAAHAVPLCHCGVSGIELALFARMQLSTLWAGSFNNSFAQFVQKYGKPFSLPNRQLNRLDVAVNVSITLGSLHAVCNRLEAAAAKNGIASEMTDWRYLPGCAYKHFVVSCQLFYNLKFRIQARVVPLKRLFPGNNYCPCGSHRKYKVCCQPRGIDYFITGSGKIKQEEPLTGEKRAAFEEAMRKFVCDNKRKPTDEEESLMRYEQFEEIERVIARELIKQGASQESIYAYEKTGIIVTHESESRIAPEELQRWTAAVQEYRYLTNQRAGDLQKS